MGRVPQTERDVNILRDFASGMGVSDIAVKNGVTNPVVYNITKYARKSFWDGQPQSVQDKIINMWNDNCDSEMISEAVNRSVPMVVGFLVYAGKTPNDPGWKPITSTAKPASTKVVKLTDDAPLISLVESGMYPELSNAIKVLVASGHDTIGRCRKVLPDVRKFPKFYRVNLADVSKLEDILMKTERPDKVTRVRDSDDYAISVTANTAKVWLSKRKPVYDVEQAAQRTANLLNAAKPKSPIRSETVLLAGISDWISANWSNESSKEDMVFILKMYAVREALDVYEKMCKTGVEIILGEVKRAGKACIVLTNTEGYMLE